MAQTIVAEAIIKAVDQFSGPLKSIVGQINGLDKSMVKAGQAMTTVGTLASSGLAALLAPLATWASTGQREVDAALRSWQTVGQASVEQRKQMEAMAMSLGPKLGMAQLELIHGATEMLQAGMKVEDLFAVDPKDQNRITLVERMALAAKTAGQPIEKFTTQLVSLANAFNLPFNTPGERRTSFDRLMGLMVAAPWMSPDTAPMHAQALTEFASIAAQLKISPEEASALQSVLSESGFRGSRGGHALKTILQRFINPTPGGLQQMSLAGVDYARIMGHDFGKLDADSLIASTKGRIDLAPHRETIAQQLAQLQPGDDILAFQSQLIQSLSYEMGLKSGDKNRRGMLERGVKNFISASRGAFNLEAFIEEMAKLPTEAFKDVAGLHHSSKAAVLATQNHLKQYKQILQQLKERAPTALDTGAKNKLEGYDYAMRRMDAALTSLKNAVWNSGFADLAIAAVTKIGDAMLKLATIDPSVLKGIGTALAVIGTGGAALAGVGLAIAAIGAGLRPLIGLGAALLASPFWVKALAAGGIAALLFGDMSTLGDLGAPLAGLLESAGVAAQSLGTSLDLAYKSLTELFGLDPGHSLLADGLKALAATVTLLQVSLDSTSATLKSISGSTTWDAEKAKLEKKFGITDADKQQLDKHFDRDGFRLFNWLGKQPPWWEWGTDKDRLSKYEGQDRDRHPPSVLDVKTNVTGDLQGQMQLNATIKVEGNGQLVDQNTTGGQIRGKLRTGESMTDTPVLDK